MAFENVTPLEEVTIPRQILLVEDEEMPRESLARILKGRGYDVVLADSGSSAIRQARTGDFGLVLMDIVLGEAMDGIDAAQKIQLVHPHTPFIFVTAFPNDPEYRERVRKSQIRDGGWLEKPIKVREIVELIDRELQKRQILAWLEEVQDYGLDPFEHLAKVADSLPPETVQDLRQELEAEVEESSELETEEIRPLKGYRGEQQLMEILAQIDSVYDEIINLIARRKGDPNLKEAVHPLRLKLKELQELQADAMERHFRSQLQYDPRQGRRIINRAKKLLGKR